MLISTKEQVKTAKKLSQGNQVMIMKKYLTGNICIEMQISYRYDKYIIRCTLINIENQLITDGQ